MKHKVAQLKTEITINQIKAQREQRRRNKKQNNSHILHTQSAENPFCSLVSLGSLVFFGRTSIELHFFSILHNRMKIWLPVINNGEKIIE